MLLLALLLPLIGFITLITIPVSRKVAGYVASGLVLASFLLFAHLLYHDQIMELPLYTWSHLPGMKVDFSLHLDHLAMLMALIITGVGFLIHAYSLGYMDHEVDYQRYFACMNLFIFAMLLLVLAGDLVLLFIGWEGVGLASYLLIGFWYERPAAASAATKAFIMNRIGDAGLLVGLLLIFTLFGTSHIATIVNQGHLASGMVLVVLTFLLFVGAMGKSAQLPLSTWLPDAMEGPTPVSALIHAATMVTAGVYLVVRFYPLYLLAPWTLNVIGVIGAITALWAALSAMMQTDLKRVLAYSTVSQLGLMFVACGAGAFYSAMFHLTTHAFVKALLFLSAGSVIHMTGTTDMNQMGGLKKSFPITHWLFLIGALALAGVPPLATFFSKDLIIEQEHLSGHTRLFIMAVIVSLLTAYYLMRAYILTFLGEARKEATEAPLVMRWPMGVLAALSLIGGFLGFTFTQQPLLENFLSDIQLTRAEDVLHSGFIVTPETGIAIAVALVGILSAFLLRRFLTQSWEIVREAFYLDYLYENKLILPLKSVGRSIFEFLEPEIFEGSMRWVADSTSFTAMELQQFQSGQIRSYVAWMAFGAGLLLIYFMLG